ncbi:hypothetical protein [Arthrobacter sp.]|uniref:hypothetical protein n=1 Tax=Arthrobacter sp. TaxID=1667 RepID=UPI00259014C2|nr:hypothetical protein [Arthrobacter sp.]
MAKIIIKLPRIAGFPRLATDLVRQANVQPDRDSIVIDGRGLVSGTESFALQLARELNELDVSGIDIIGGTPDWELTMTNAAESREIPVQVIPLSQA